MNSVLITGCNRGLGLGLVHHFLKVENAPQHIFATVRDISKADELKILAAANPNITILQLDVTDYNSFSRLVGEVEAKVHDKGLNLLFNNAGVGSKHGQLDAVEPSDFTTIFSVNVTAPIMLTKAMTPLLKKGASSGRPAWIVNMSSQMGSIADNSSGGYLPYRASKAALNACTKSISLDLKKDNVLSIVMHPGWVQTDMGGAGAPLTVDQSCSNMVNTVVHLSEADNGKFLRYDKKELPW